MILVDTKVRGPKCTRSGLHRHADSVSRQNHNCHLLLDMRASPDSIKNKKEILEAVGSPQGTAYAGKSPLHWCSNTGYGCAGKKSVPALDSESTCIRIQWHLGT